MQQIILIFFLLFAVPATALSTPACYEQAAVPAHEFVFRPPQTFTEVTGLTWNGEECLTIPFWNGSPVVRQEIYAPFRKVYEAYARAVEQQEGASAQRLYTYVRPTPRSFSFWLWLANDPEGPLMPWGMSMTLKIVRVLQPSTKIEKALLIRGDRDLPILDMQRTWPVLYLLMGGEVYPKDEWVESQISSHMAQQLLHWRYPNYLVESHSAGKGKTSLRLR